MLLHQRTGLTTKALFLTAVLALLVWFISDNYLSKNLGDMFQNKLAERFQKYSQEHRSLFDRHVKIYNQSAKLLVNTTQLHKYLQDKHWANKDKFAPIIHIDTPAWLPSHSVLRKFLLPRYALLLDTNNKPREIYHWGQGKFSQELMHLPDFLLYLAQNQSYLTTLGEQPFLITAEEIYDDKARKIATLLLAAPLDSEFMRDSQSMSSTASAVALLAEDEETILVSSDPELIPSGIKLSEISDIYQSIGEGFFDYGSTDLVIKFVSFVPMDEVRELTEEVLKRDRSLRAFTTAAYTLVFILIILYLTHRLKGLSRRVIDFSARMAIKQPDIKIRDEILLLEERFKLLANAIKHETEALEYQASHDPLTDLPNRKMLNDRLQGELLRCEIRNSSLVLLISDLNHFKEINDTLGHHIGDLVLQQAAERLYLTVRKSDMVARLGGDEFSIILTDSNIEQAERVARQILDVFKKPFSIEGHKLNVGISIGIVESPLHGDDVNILMQRADVAMYNAKRNNLGFSIYRPEQDQHDISRLQLMSELSDAIKYERLELYYQSKIDVQSGKVIGAEALLRWNHPVRGFIQPDEFIPMAEQTGLIKPLSYWVISHALKQCAIWHKRGLNLSVAINISVQCLYDEKLLKSLRKEIQANKIPANKCILELTESDLMNDPIRAKHILSELKTTGASISIDDFGTGYSSLAYLKQLPVSEIKIDRSFVMEMLEDDNDRIIVQTIIDLAHNLGLSVVAEGVTSEQTLIALREQGCDTGQGFFIAKPQPADAFLEYLSNEQVIRAS
ncbi:MAG: EAL domain-containing protein [Gammaproteobacteria bacterium]|nr:EAL domain-containing protein [Gammaproteobacteria bacterium]